MIKQLRLFQFKAFKEQVFSLSNLNLLAGVNGMGKSSLIQSLLILRSSYDRGELQNGSFLTIQHQDLINLVSPDAILNADADSSEVSISITEDECQGQWKINAEGINNSLPLKDHTVNTEILNTSLFNNSFQYLNAERIGPRQFYERLSVSRNHSPLGYRGEFTASKLSEVATNLTKLEHEKLFLSKSNLIYEQVSNWLSEIIHPGTKISLDESNPSQISILYNFARQKGKSFNPLNIGFGFSFALPIIVAILTAPKHSLVIIENPEAHLHPKGQAEMGKFLALAAESGIQIIIETHSDHILNGIRIAVKDKMVLPESTNIIFVGSYDDNGRDRVYVEELEIDEDGRISEWPKDFFDTWEYSMMHLL